MDQEQGSLSLLDVQIPLGGYNVFVLIMPRLNSNREFTGNVPAHTGDQAASLCNDHLLTDLILLQISYHSSMETAGHNFPFPSDNPT